MPGDLLRVVRQDADRRQPEVGEDLVADPVVARVGREAELEVRLDRVEPVLLQLVGLAACSAGRCRGPPAPCRGARRAPRRRSAASACSSCSPQSQRSEWKTSPVRHSEWTRTSTFSAPSTSPLTSATWCLPVSFSRNATAVNSPYAVGSRTAVVALDELLVRRRYSIRSATVTSFSPCRSQYGIRSGRAPSSRPRS